MMTTEPYMERLKDLSVKVSLLQADLGGWTWKGAMERKTGSTKIVAPPLPAHKTDPRSPVVPSTVVRDESPSYSGKDHSSESDGPR